MGSGSLSVVLAWAPAHAAVLVLLDIGTLIQQPAVLLGAAAIVVVAVLIVLIMVLRGGSKKGEMASEMEDDQQPWEESAPQAAVGQPGRGYDARDQMLPWEQGGGRMDGGRPPVGGKRGAMARDPQAGWGQPEEYEERNAQWEAPGQALPRGGQWGADQWAPAGSSSGRGASDQRTPQGQMAPRDQESWGWGAGQGAAGPQSIDEWGQGPAAPTASPAMGRDADQWGQRKPPVSPAMGRENDQWGQAPGGPPASGRDIDQWGQPASPLAPGRENNQWGQPKPSSSMGWDNNQWGQQGVATPAMGRENDEWGQGTPMRGRAQDEWGQPAPSMGRGVDQPGDQGAGMRSGPRRGADVGGQDEGQWGQGSWGQDGSAWESAGAADRWSQGAQAPQASWSAQPGGNRSGPGSIGGTPSQPASGGEWGGQSFDRPGQSSAQPGDAWGTREPPIWQAPDSRQEPPSWESPAQRSPSTSRPQWEEAGRAGGESGWESRGGAAEWGQPAQGPKPSASRPVEPAGARGMSQPSVPSAGDWSERDFERPTARPGQSGGWEQREAPARQVPAEPEPPAWQAPARQSSPEPAAPAWQSPAPQMAAPSSPPESPAERRAPEVRQVPRGSPDDTAYGPPASGGASDGEDAKTVVMRKDAAPGRVPAVVVRQGKEPGRTYEMRKEQIRIGRSRESDIFLEDLAVSRLHATIYRDEMGVYQLRDENSANGTSVNGQRVTECALQEGDEIQLGQTILAFVRR